MKIYITYLLIGATLVWSNHPLIQGIEWSRDIYIYIHIYIHIYIYINTQTLLRNPYVYSTEIFWRSPAPPAPPRHSDDKDPGPVGPNSPRQSWRSCAPGRMTCSAEMPSVEGLNCAQKSKCMNHVMLFMFVSAFPFDFLELQRYGGFGPPRTGCWEKVGKSSANCGKIHGL